MPQLNETNIDAPIERNSLVIIVVAAIVASVAYFPLLIPFATRLWSRPEYQHFPFIFVAAIALFVCDWNIDVPAPQINQRRLRAISLTFMLSAGILLLVAYLLPDERVSGVSFVLCICSIATFAASVHVAPKLWRTLLLLWLIIPPPFGLDTKLIQWLRLLSTKFSSNALDILGVHHIATGNVLELPGRELFVDDACSGIVSALSVIAVVLIYTVWKGRSFIHSVALFIGSILFAVGMNVARICIIAWALAKYDVDWTSGTPHEILGLTLFVVTAIVVFSSDQLLEFLLGSIESQHVGSEVSAWLIRKWNAMTSWMKRSESTADGALARAKRMAACIGHACPVWAAAITAALFSCSAALAFTVYTPRAPVDESCLTIAEQLDRDVAPESVGDWVRRNYQKVVREENALFGKNSMVFSYENTATGQNATLSFDFPYRTGWHDLDFCYVSSGWSRHGRGVVAHDDQWNVLEAAYERSGAYGYLVFAEFEGDGKVVSPPTGKLREFFWRKNRQDPLTNTLVLQVQVWSESPKAVSKDDIERLRQLLFATRGRFRTPFLGQ